jgi:hypothetical protein
MCFNCHKACDDLEFLVAADLLTKFFFIATSLVIKKFWSSHEKKITCNDQKHLVANCVVIEFFFIVVCFWI